MPQNFIYALGVYVAGAVYAVLLHLAGQTELALLAVGSGYVSNVAIFNGYNTIGDIMAALALGFGVVGLGFVLAGGL